MKPALPLREHVQILILLIFHAKLQQICITEVEPRKKNCHDNIGFAGGTAKPHILI